MEGYVYAVACLCVSVWWWWWWWNVSVVLIDEQMSVKIEGLYV